MDGLVPLAEVMPSQLHAASSGASLRWKILWFLFTFSALTISLQGQEVGDLSCNSTSVGHMSSRFKGALMSKRSKCVKTRKRKKWKGTQNFFIFPCSPTPLSPPFFSLQLLYYSIESFSFFFFPPWKSASWFSSGGHYSHILLDAFFPYA